MNKKETLLVQLMEECSEVQKAVSKILRFGSSDSISYESTNMDELIQELIDIESVIDALLDENVIPSYEHDLEFRKSVKRKKIDLFCNMTRYHVVFDDGQSFVLTGDNEKDAVNRVYKLHSEYTATVETVTKLPKEIGVI